MKKPEEIHWFKNGHTVITRPLDRHQLLGLCNFLETLDNEIYFYASESVFMTLDEQKKFAKNWSDIVGVTGSVIKFCYHILLQNRNNALLLKLRYG